jgi:hypothetical protein
LDVIQQLEICESWREVQGRGRGARPVHNMGIYYGSKPACKDSLLILEMKRSWFDPMGESKGQKTDQFYYSTF